MPPLGRPVAALRGSRIFGGFLRFLTRYWKEPSDLSRAAKHGLLFADHGQPVTGSLPAADAICPPVAGHGSRITAGRSRLPDRGARITVAGSRLPDHSR